MGHYYGCVKFEFNDIPLYTKNESEYPSREKCINLSEWSTQNLKFHCVSLIIIINVIFMKI